MPLTPEETICLSCNDTGEILKDEVDHEGNHVQVRLPCDCKKGRMKRAIKYTHERIGGAIKKLSER